MSGTRELLGVSWSNFQEERWKTDEAAIQGQLEKLGAKYISADAGGSPEKQLADIDGLMAKGAKALTEEFSDMFDGALCHGLVFLLVRVR